jgi:hypothetical protein
MMRTYPGLVSIIGKVVLGTFFLAAFSFVGPGGAVSAQQRGPVQRVLQGKVTDKADAAIKGAVVYLKDDHTLSVRSYFSDSEGAYRFGQLAQNTDFEVWAESDGRKSSVKTISSFDSKNQVTINLKIDK